MSDKTIIEIPEEGKLTNLAKNYLLQVIEILKANPEKYRQDTDLGGAACESPQCIYGWMQTLYLREYADAFLKTLLIDNVYANDLGLTYNQYEILYGFSLWPIEFTKGFTSENVTAEMAIKRINHFIETNGKE